MGNAMIFGGARMTVPFALPPVGTSLNDMSWEDIVKISDAGQAANYFAIGDTKGVPLNGTVGALTFSNETYYAFIIGIDHNESVEGKGIHFQFGKTTDGKDVAFISSDFYIDSTNSNSGGWKSCDLRNNICASFLSVLPSELQVVISPCTKYTDNTGNKNTATSCITATEDSIFLLAEFEVHGTRKYAHNAEQNYQEQYAYYAAGNSKVKYKHNATTTATTWWVRSTHYNSTVAFCDVATSGAAHTNTLQSTNGFAPCFKVGGAA